jgi:N,N'-diacetyl-8-epilegionaminate cytidylyltransferase
VRLSSDKPSVGNEIFKIGQIAEFDLRVHRGLAFCSMMRRFDEREYKVYGFIFARGGSKGVPRKNIRPLGGKPLIAHAIETARACPSIDRIIVSTDDKEIADVARAFGAEVPFIRPEVLAQDSSPEWLAWRHAIQAVGLDDSGIFVSIPTTAPLRSPLDVEATISEIASMRADICITVTPAASNPYFNMISVNASGCAELVIPPKPGTVARRQDAPKVFEMTTAAYAAAPSFVLREQSLFSGRVKTVVLPRERAIDIDTELDFEIAEFLYLRRQKSSRGA